MDKSSQEFPKVLVVDDQEDLRDLVSFYLEKAFQVQLFDASNAKEAKEVLEKQEIQFIVSDYNMPGGNGGELFQYLKEKNKKTPFILVSTERPDQFSVFSEGPLLGYAQKPQFEEKLIELLKTVLPKKNTEVKKSYVPVRLSYLDQLSPLNFDLFIQLSKKKYLCVLKKGEVFDENEKQRFLNKKIQNLFLKKSDVKRFLRAYRKKVVSTLYIDSVSIEKTYEVSRKTLSVVKKLREQLGWSEELMEVTGEQIQLVMNHFSKHPKAERILDRVVVDLDHYLVSHSHALVSVTAWIAELLGWKDKKTRYILAASSILHDLTLKNHELMHIKSLMQMSKIPQKRDIQDVQVFCNHPMEAKKIADRWEEIPEEVAIVVSQHHELPDGTGFPRGISANQIHPLTALFIIAEDIVDQIYLYGKERFDLQKFLSKRKSFYQLAPFSEIVQVLEKDSWGRSAA